LAIRFRLILRDLGLGVLAISGSMFVILAIGLLHAWLGRAEPDRMAQAPALVALAIGAAASGLVGGVMWLGGRRQRAMINRREALLLVALTWVLGAAAAALPLRLWAWLETGEAPDHRFHSFVACYFEAMSGLTTTGATVLGEIDAMPRVLLLWRAATQWLGGLGIVVLFVAVLPTLGVGGKRLFQVESAGPKTEGVRPRIGETARVLWLTYLVFTVVMAVLLRALGMDWIDSLCHTFATLATGGFSTSDASVGGYRIPGVQAVIVLFMILAGVNFGLYYRLTHGRWKTVVKDPELLTYLGLMLSATVVIALLLGGQPIDTTDGRTTQGWIPTLHHSLFQVVSIQTSTGFGTADFEQWPFLAKAILVGLMFVGGSAGSTAGGMKVIRVLIVAKVLAAEIRRVFQPQAVLPMKLGRRPIDPETRVGAMVYVLIIFALWIAGGVVLMLLEQDQGIGFITAITASAATLNNIGPGLAAVGPVQNYGWFSDASLAWMSLLMALGRLEVYALAVLVVPSYWRSP